MTVTDELRRQVLAAAGLGSKCTWPIVVLDKVETDRPPTAMGHAGFWIDRKGVQHPDVRSVRPQPGWVKAKATFRIEVGIEFIEYLIALNVNKEAQP